MLAHWWQISPIMLCDTMKALHHRRAGGLAWGAHKQEPLPSGRTFLQPFPSSTLRFPLPLLCLSLRFCLIMTYLKTRWVDYLEGWLFQMFLVSQMQILALKCPAHHNTLNFLVIYMTLHAVVNILTESNLIRFLVDFVGSSFDFDQSLPTEVDERH